MRKNIYGTFRSDEYPYGTHPPAISYTESDEIVSRAEPDSGCFYQMEYEVGHGGGHRMHRINVEDLVVKISYVSSSCTEPSDVVNFDYDHDDNRSDYSWESADSYIFDADGVDT